MRLSSIVWIFVIVCAASALYSVKYRVQGMDEEIVAMKRQIESEKSALHVLNAEWAYLTRPDRVRKLSEKYLSLAPVSGLQLADVAEVPFPEGGAVRVVKADEAEPSANALKRGVIQVGGVESGGGGYVR